MLEFLQEVLSMSTNLDKIIGVEEAVKMIDNDRYLFNLGNGNIFGY
jgi:hypothetical protein